MKWFKYGVIGASLLGVSCITGTEDVPSGEEFGEPVATERAALVTSGSIGVFRNGTWFFDLNDNRAWDASDTSSSFGQAGDKPVVFSGCTFNTPNTDYADLGIVRTPSTWFMTKNDLNWDAGDAANTFTFGTNGKPTIWNTAPVSFEGGTFFVDWNNNHVWDAGDVALPFGLGTDQPVIGVWAGSTQRIGVFRNGQWFVDSNGTNAWDAGDSTYTFGQAGDIAVTIPVPGGPDRIAVFRNGTWFVDANGNHVWNGTGGGDEQWTFGQTGDIPVVVRGLWKCKPIT